MDTRVHMQEAQQITYLVDLVVENFKYSQLCFWIRSLNLIHQITIDAHIFQDHNSKTAQFLGNSTKKTAMHRI
jgi:hypothetical protein